MIDHVVLISIDTLRSDCVAANPLRLWPEKYPGLRAPTTDGLDALAARGVFLPNCLSAAPYTSASHATFFTGRWPVRHGVYEFFHRRLSAPTLFSAARQRGYRTTWKVDFPIILGSFLGFDADVDDYRVEDDDGFLETVATTERSVSFVHFGGAHIPYGFHNLRYGGAEYRRAVEALEEEVPHDVQLPKDQLVESWRDQEDLALLLRYKRVVQHHMAEGRHHRLFEMYLRGVDHFMRTRFDPFLDRLIQKLAGKRALIVLFGDHGEEYDAESYGHHNTLAEGVLRVPLMLVGAGLPPGLVLDRVRSVDLAPTLLELLGWPADALGEIDGTSFVPTLRGEGPPALAPAFAQAWTSDTTDFVRFQKRLLNTNAHPGFLRHVLYKEAVYDGDLRLERQMYTYGGSGGVWGLTPCPTRVTLTRGGSVVPVDDPCAPRLGALLSSYNAWLDPHAEARRVPEALRGQLRAAGYPV